MERLGADIVLKIADLLASATRTDMCYCNVPSYMRGLLRCGCDRAAFSDFTGVRDLISFAATCKKMQSRFKISHEEVARFRRRDLFLNTIGAVRLFFPRRISFLAARAEIWRQHCRTGRDWDYHKKHEIDNICKVRRHNTCKCSPAAPSLVVVRCGCGKIAHSAHDDVMSASW